MVESFVARLTVFNWLIERKMHQHTFGSGSGSGHQQAPRLCWRTRFSEAARR